MKNKNNKPLILALYLPQYYKTDYNDDWWGDEYTEWVATKKATPLFKDQYQPKIPLNNNYYDLTKIESIENQFDLAKQYNIDGFVIYQYYSCNASKYGKKIGESGSLLLEKPTELILNNKHLDRKFCLYWANHDWRKTWFGQDETMLWKQLYGSKKEWKEYFDYNLQFFNDTRYIKINNKPVFFIFATWHFKEIECFIEYWNELAKENGFEGIYFIKTLDARTNENIEFYNGVFYREPFYTFSKGLGNFALIRRIIRTRFAKYYNRLCGDNKGIISYKCNYDRAWKSIINRKFTEIEIPGAFVEWDNTARKKYNAQILTGANSTKFQIYFSKLYNKSKYSNSPFIVINAWNEWAEGAYLEPDTKSKYEYLEAIKKIVED